MTEEWPWLEQGPVFSTRGERGSRVLRVPQGVTLGPLGIRYIAIIAGLMVTFGLAIAGAGLVVGTALLDGDAAGWWWLALVLSAAFGAVHSFSGLYMVGTEGIMKSSTLGMVYLVGFSGGAAVGLGLLALWSARAPRGGEGLRHETVLLVGTATAAVVVCAVSAVVAVSSVRRARREVERVLSMRRSASRYSGIVARLPDPKEWNGGGDVPIRYRDDHEEHLIRVRLNTYAHRIPVVGSRVIVFIGSDGDLLVEIDPEHPTEFYPHSSRYDSDTSGGGS